MIFCGGTAIPRTIDFDGLRRDRRRVRRRPGRRHRAHRRARRRRRAPVTGRARRRGHDHDPQDAPRPARRDGDVQRAARRSDRARGVPGPPGRPAQPHHGGDRGRAARGDHARVRRLRARIVANAQALAEALLERGFDLVSGGTDNHLILIDLTSKGVSGKPAAQALDRAGIVTNHNAIPFDPRKPLDPSGLRIGTPAVTTRGMGAAEMRTIARLDRRGHHRRRRHARAHPQRGARADGGLPAPAMSLDSG